MNIKIADLNISNDERLYGTLIKELETIGYIVVEDDLIRGKYVIARKNEQE